MEIINPLKGKTSNGWHFEQEIHDVNGIARAVKAGGGSGNVPKVLTDAQPLKRRRTEDERRRRHLHGDKGATFSKGKESYIGNDGIANTVTTVFSKDNIIAEIMERKETKQEIKERGINKRYRIRKLTPRECFRLMDLTESDIDKIQNAGISESQQYRMAGNSIVVSCMVGIFENLFCKDGKEETGQLTLF